MIRPFIAAALLMAGPALAESPLPFDVGGPYALINHHGQPHTQVDPDGQPQLLFFGYANCPAICSAAMPLMADIADNLAGEGITIRPVMITVDPARDTVEAMGPALAKIHDRFLGLTGDEDALAVAYAAFSVEHELAYVDIADGPIYTHGSLIYLMDAEGEVLTLIPPVLDDHTATQIALKYLRPKAG